MWNVTTYSEVLRGSRGVLEMAKDAISIPHELIAALIVPIEKNINTNTNETINEHENDIHNVL